MILVTSTHLSNTQEIKIRLKEILEILMTNEVTKPLTPQKLKSILVALGPQFLELGRILSEQNTFLPEDYSKELYNPDPVRSIINYSSLVYIIETEYGTTLSDVFTEFNEEPLFASPLYQCHKAILKDGSEVIVKIQNPKLKMSIPRDIELIKKAIGVLNPAPDVEKRNITLSEIFNELWTISKRELNFFVESSNTNRFYKLNSNKDNILSPKVDPKYNTPNIIVIEYIEGTPLSDLSSIKSQVNNLSDVSDIVSKNYIKQIFIDGFFHPYPDSRKILFRNGNIVWTDFSVMGELSPYDLDALKNTISAIKSGDIDVLRDILLTVNTNSAQIDESKLNSSLKDTFDFEHIKKLSANPFPVTNIIKSLLSILNVYNIYFPESYSYLLFGLISIESILLEINPKLNLVDSIKNIVFVNDRQDEKSAKSKESQYIQNNEELTENKIINDKCQECNDRQNIKFSNDDDKAKSVNLSHKEKLDQAIKKLFEVEKSNDVCSDILAETDKKLDGTDLSKGEKSDDIDIAHIADVLRVQNHNKARLDVKVKIDRTSVLEISNIAHSFILALLAICFLIISCITLSLNLSVPSILGISALAFLSFCVSVVLIVWILVRLIRNR